MLCIDFWGDFCGCFGGLFWLVGCCDHICFAFEFVWFISCFGVGFYVLILLAQLNC